jgi:hypothetical protein
MLEPHVLGVHWRVPSVFRHKHPPVAAMEGVGLGDSAHEPLSQALGGYPSCSLPSQIDLMNHIHTAVLYALDLNHTCIL